MASIPEFDSEQLKFLRENFVVVNPFTRETSQNFSSLWNCRLVGLPDIHHSVYWQEIQNLFLKNICNKEGCCLVEGFAPEQQVDRSVFSEWPDLPKGLSILGADVRSQPDEMPRAVRRHELANRNIRLHLQDQKFTSRIVKEIAELFKDGTVCREEKTLTVDDVALKTMNSLLAKREPLHAEINNLKREYDALGFPKGSYRVRDSNKELEKLVLKIAALQPFLVLFWGKDHFLFGADLVRTFEKANITYCLLQPSQESLQKALAEEERRGSHAPLKAFNLVSKTGAKSYLKMEKEDATHFSPAVQSIMLDLSEPKGPIHLFNHAFVLQLLNSGTTYSFKPGTRLHIPCVSSEDFMFFTDEENSNLTLDRVVDCLRMPFILAGFHIDIEFRGSIEIFYDTTTQEPVLQVKSNEPIVIKASNAPLITTLERLLAVMQLRDIEKFTLPANRTLVLTDMTPADLQDFNKDKLLRWMNSKCPYPLKVDFQGNLNCNYDQENQLFSITSSNGLSLILTPAITP